LEASTGIEPVYTDLQSADLSRKTNDIGSKKYQDISGTRGEPDTINLTVQVPKKNAALSAKGNGVNQDKKAANFQGDYAPKLPRNAMLRYAKDAHNRVSDLFTASPDQGSDFQLIED